MGSIIQRIIILSFLFCGLPACGGYYNKYGQAVPYFPKWEYKDKPGFVFPKDLDTNNVYIEVEQYYNGVKKYPSNNLDTTKNWDHRFLAFYSDGRFLVIKGRNIYDSVEIDSSYLNPNRSSKERGYSLTQKGYYFSKGGTQISTEIFFLPHGGRYLRSKVVILGQGDTLIQKVSRTKCIYKRYKISYEWKKQYKVDW